jgi:hypothetical protein
MKPITSKDPRKAAIVARFKLVYGADRVTNVREGNGEAVADLLRFEGQKYSVLALGAKVSLAVALLPPCPFSWEL